MKVSIRSLVFCSIFFISSFLSVSFIMFLNHSYEKELFLIFEHEVESMHLQVKSKIDIYFENIFKVLKFADSMKIYDEALFLADINEVESYYTQSVDTILHGYNNIKDFKFCLFYTFSNYKKININFNLNEVVNREFSGANFKIINEDDELDYEIKEKFLVYLKGDKKHFHDKVIKKSIHFFKVCDGVHAYSQHSSDNLLDSVYKHQQKNLFYLFLFLFIVFLFSLLLASYIRASILNLINIICEIKEFNLVPYKAKKELEEIEIVINIVNQVKLMLVSFKKFAPIEIIKKLMKSGEVIKCDGVFSQATIMFSDIRSFTSLAEEIDASDLFEFMNSYFEIVYNIIIEFNGNIDKSIGDSVMALWNAPSEIKDHAYLACCAALKCCDLLKNSKLKHKIDTNFGINTGNVAVGTIGSNEKLQYSALGDNVNIASRLETLNKIYGTNILISEFTYELIKNKLQARIVDKVLLKGKMKCLLVYELLFEDAKNDEIIELSSKAFDFMEQNDIEKALFLYKKLLEVNKNDGVAKYMIAKLCVI